MAVELGLDDLLGRGVLGDGDEVRHLAGVAVVPDLSVQRRHGLVGVQRTTDAVLAEPSGLRQLGDGRLVTVDGLQPRTGRADLHQGVVQCDGQADGPLARRDATLDRLADPPGRVGGELEPTTPVELLHGPDQPEVALLDQLVEAQLGPLGELRCHRHHEAEVGVDEVVEGGLAGIGDDLQLHPLLGGQHLVLVVQACPRLDAGLDGLRQPHLVGRSQQRDLSELTEVEVEQVLGNRAVKLQRSPHLPFRPSRSSGAGRPRLVGGVVPVDGGVAPWVSTALAKCR